MADLTGKTEELEIGQSSDRIELHSDTPISSLPYEVLAAVFFIGWQTQMPRGHLTEGPLPFEIAISHVSHHWRCVALGTPTLWTNIIRFQFQKDIDSISAYLCRSGLVAFDLTIAIGVSYDELETALEPEEEEEEEALNRFEQDMEDIGPFYHLVNPHLERCKSLIIHLQQYTEGQILLRRLSTIRASSLRSLKVSYNMGIAIGPTFTTPLKIFQGGASALNHLDLNNVSLASCHPPTSNLTSLSVKSLFSMTETRPGANFVTALSSMHLLSRLEIEEKAYRWSSDMPIKLPKLRQLIYTPSATTSFLIALDAPLLESVSFISPPTKTALDATLVEHCLEKLPLVRTLCLRCGEHRLSPTNARVISRAFPLITNLSYSPPRRFNSKEEPGEFFAYLKEVDSLHGGMWPHLTTFEIPSSAGLMIFPMEAIKATLIFRASAGYPIRTFVLPESRFEEGLALTSCTQPPVRVLKYTDDTPEYFPQRELV
ncbi:hypothetical protein FIBSPDRAFT_1054856 [Athelia psychrophila]|uniref:Uncharacterized protein n=1 Tax=Athelia psychrophila TaxID=1759441 RepID=A0A167UQD7_9AGAM|nr:hypothetical protein FIBSPDRAFT_1054856 [Fibularhizoctonia sp. CBS 109695]